MKMETPIRNKVRLVSAEGPPENLGEVSRKFGAGNSHFNESASAWVEIGDREFLWTVYNNYPY